MDINSLKTSQALFAANRPENTLNLKVGQQLDVKVIGADIQAAKTAIALTLGNKDISVQSNQPITLNPNQDLKIQVTQIAPVVEFKIIAPLPETNNLRLKLISTARDGGSAVTGMEPVRPTARDGGSAVTGMEPVRPTARDGGSAAIGRESMQPAVKPDGSAPLLPLSQPLDAKIIGIAGNKIQLQIFTPPTQATADSGNKQAALINIDRNQLGNAPQGLRIGQTLNLEVIKTGASPEFKVITAANNIGRPLEAKIIAITGNKIQLQVPSQASGKQVSVITIEQSQLSNAPSNLKVGQSLNLEVVKAGAAPEFKVIPASNNIGQPLEAKIIGIAGNKIQLQVFTPIPAQTRADTLITIERGQLSNTPSDLKVGQSLSLEITKTGSAPEFKIIQAAKHIPEAKITEFIKQFLPRHEPSPIFLNQLIKDLPQLMKNESVSQVLKDIAASIIRNLPPKEQLISSEGLKQSIANSGLFLEAKLSPAMTQAELIKQLPQLIKNESVPQSLQRIAVEILQNLTQKEPLPSASVIEQAVNSKLISEAEFVPSNPLDTAKADGAPAEAAEQGMERLPKAAKADALETAGAVAGAGEKALPVAVAEDFKANLLKFIQALKQELGAQNGQPPLQIDLDLLKNLQNKTENSVATIVLDQLMSLPKDDNPKQLWSIDIPFIDRQQAETVKIEIQQDKENQRQSSGGRDWSVNITLTPPELGTIHCIVSYRNDVINTYFKSRNPQTTELIKHNLDYLKNQLEESGLTTGHMDALDGAQKTQAPQQLIGKKLFDENA
ncbi:MAG: flagellar hook-length control protein FliK [Methylococcaceae bacterium]